MTPEPASPKSAASLPPIPALLASMVSLQFGASLAKGLFPALGAAGSTFVRVILSALIMLLVFRPPLHRLSAQQWRAAAVYGVALGGMNLTFYLALQYLPLGLAVAIEFLGPLTIAVFSSRRAADLVWVLLAAIGIVMITPLGAELTGTHNALPWTGLLLALGAAFCWGLYILIGAKVSRLFDGMLGVSAGMLCAAVVVGIGASVLGFSLAHLTPALLGTGLLVALLSSVVPYSLEMVALRSLPRRLFSILLSLEPAVAALMGFLVMHERLSVVQLLAIVCIIVASGGATWSGRAEVH